MQFSTPQTQRQNEEPAIEVTEESPAQTSSPTSSQPAGNRPMRWWEAIHAGDDDALSSAVSSELSNLMSKNSVLSNYLTLFLFDEDSISNYHSDRLYAAASSAKDSKKDILLIVHSTGGRIEPAYLISKTLKRLAATKFVVAVPRRAKSAATLLALGADEIHMGMISQLGPIDPQFSGLPVLALGNAIDRIAELTCKFPAASEMFTKYLTDQVPIRILGYYQRVSESAAQYAERLISDKKLANGKTREQVAQHLVQHYKDHDFVIDSDEATSILGPDIVKVGTAEYAAADEIYKFFEWIGMFLALHNKQYWFVGGETESFGVRTKPGKKD